MSKCFAPSFYLYRFFLIIYVLLLAACGGGSSGTASESTNAVTSIILSGSVGDGPVTGALITITDANGTVLANTVSDDKAQYKATVPADAIFPITITATEGLDLVTGTAPDFTMVTMAATSTETNANINPFSTFIVKTAKNMEGGANPTNLDLANQIVMNNMNFGLDSTIIENPITTVITEQNIATIVKSSEVAGEMIRRAHNALIITGNTIDKDELIDSLAADLVDGLLDGSDAKGNANPLFSAAAHIAAGEVLVEALSNNLYVNGILATGLMDNAIRISLPGTDETTANAAINDKMLNQTRISLGSAQTISPDGTITDIASLLNSIPANINPDEIAALLPPERSADISSVLITVGLSNDNELEMINTAAKDLLATSTSPAVSLMASPSTITKGDFTTLTWATKNISSCESSGPIDWNAAGNHSGLIDVGPLSINSTFVLTCINESGQEASASITVNIIDDSPENEPDTISYINDIIDIAPISSDNENLVTDNATTSDITPQSPAGTSNENTGNTGSGNNIIISSHNINGDNINNTANTTAVSQLTRINIASATASAFKADTGRIPGNVFDGDLSTVWASSGMPQWITIDLGAEYSVSKTRISFFGYNQNRLYNYTIEAAAVDGNWITLKSNIESSANLWTEETFGAVRARFLRITLNAASNSGWATINEIEIYGNSIVETANNPKLTLSWNSSPEDVLGYTIFFGASADNINRQLSNIPADTVDFDPMAPSMSYMRSDILNLLSAGDNACFKIRSYNDAGQSSFSEPICTAL